MGCRLPVCLSFEYWKFFDVGRTRPSLWSNIHHPVRVYRDGVGLPGAGADLIDDLFVLARRRSGIGDFLGRAREAGMAQMGRKFREMAGRFTSTRTA
jgi:hypothetical protein